MNQDSQFPPFPRNANHAICADANGCPRLQRGKVYTVANVSGKGDLIAVLLSAKQSHWYQSRRFLPYPSKSETPPKEDGASER